MPEENESTELTETEGNFVVLELMEDVLVTEKALRGCFDTASDMGDTEKMMLISFVHYVFARPIGMSKCSKTDADQILGALLSTLMTTAPELDFEKTKATIPTISRLLSAGDPETVHISTSTSFFLQAIENSGFKITSDDEKLRLLLTIVGPLQVEVSMFLKYVLKQYRLDWTPTSGEISETKRRQAADIAELRQAVREESERIRGV